MIRPATGVACGVDIFAAEEIGLYIQLLDFNLTLGDLVVDPLM